jgi:feruloyl esterase
VNGQHLGYIPDPSECRYDPTHDASVICVANGGTNTTADCVTPLQAQAMNKIWYGLTRDGTAPPPSADNSWSVHVGGNHLWYGLTRGTNVGSLAGAGPFTIATDLVALEMQNPTLATPSFVNATGNGANGWKSLSYTQLATAYDNGLTLQSSFAHINTDDANLRPFRRSGGKMLMYHGLADILIMPQGSINYYERVLREMDGLREVQKFYRFFLVPGMTHGIGNGTSNPKANPPLPGVAGADGTTQLYGVLTDWVEKGIAPKRIDISSAVTADFPVAKSRPLCAYPKKATYVGGDINVASSYVCAVKEGNGGGRNNDDD